MAATLQIRNVPDDLRHQLEERAARSEASLNDYILRGVSVCRGKDGHAFDVRPR